MPQTAAEFTSYAEAVTELEQIARDAAAVDRTDTISVERLGDRLYQVAEQFETLAEPPRR